MPHPDDPRTRFADHCVELLGSVGRVQARRMFGGHGLYLDGLMFALIIEERLYLKTDAQNAASLRAAGGAPFTYDGARGPVVTSYVGPPDEAMDSPALMAPWARSALEAALRARVKRKPKAPARTKSAAPSPARSSRAAKRPTR